MQDADIVKHHAALNSIFEDCKRVILAHTEKGFSQDAALLHLAETLRLTRFALPHANYRGCATKEQGDETGG